MLKGEWALHLGMAAHARLVRSDGESRLLVLKTSVRIVAVAAVHCSFENFVTERLRELSFGFCVAAHAELGLAVLQHRPIREVRSLSRRTADERDRSRTLRAEGRSVSRVAVGAADVVLPVISTAEIIVILFSRVTREAALRCGLWI